MNKIEEAKKLLQQKINRLKEKEAKIKLMERKQRTRRLIELGGLVEKAGLSSLSPAQLLGALLQVKDHTQDESIVQDWLTKGEAEFTKGKGSLHNEKPIVVRFPSEPDREIRKTLRSLGLRWNAVRKEWEGHADPHALRSSLPSLNMTLQEIMGM